MTTKELRIGNLVLASEIPHFVYQIWANYGCELAETADGMGDLDYDIGDIEGLPITDETMIKLGFEKSNFKNEWVINTSWFTIRNLGDGFKLCAADGCFNEIKIEYVHQLQNLFFIITGKELITKLFERG